MIVLKQIFNLLQQTIIIAPPILITAVGACISEKSGVVNIGLEGIMLSSAFATAVVNIATGNPYLGIIAGSTPLAKSLANRPLMIIIIYAIAIAMYFFLYKTVLGLRIRSVGEHPLAADTVGISVYKTRYIAVLISGALGGLGGAYLTAVLLPSFSNNMSAGRGYIAMAAMIFGKWNPLGAILASLLFAFGQAFADVSKTIGLPISQQFLTMIPYVLTLLALVGFVGKSKAPKASGLPYEK